LKLEQLYVWSNCTCEYSVVAWPGQPNITDTIVFHEMSDLG
jgi:hypothetical protein